MAKSICDYVSTNSGNNNTYSLAPGNRWCFQTPEMVTQGKAQPLSKRTVFVPEGRLAEAISLLSAPTGRISLEELPARLGQLDYNGPECKRGYLFGPAPATTDLKALPYAKSDLLERRVRVPRAAPPSAPQNAETRGDSEEEPLPLEGLAAALGEASTNSPTPPPRTYSGPRPGGGVDRKDPPKPLKK